MTAAIHRRAALWGVLLAVALIAAAGSFFMLAAGHSLAFSACNGTYTLFAENARCRWPAVWALVLLGSLVSAAVAVFMVVWHFVRLRRQGRDGTAHT